MKAVLITYNQSLTEEVQEILDQLSIRGYTQWTDIKGRGTVEGEPHEGTHTWPEQNNAHLTVIEDDRVPALLDQLRSLNNEVEKQGMRAFVWNIESAV
jgi:nitrogen regulatory protein PII